MGLQPQTSSILKWLTIFPNLLLVVITLISLFVLALLVYVVLAFRAVNPLLRKRRTTL